jgi:hypothetical protein
VPAVAASRLAAGATAVMIVLSGRVIASQRLINSPTHDDATAHMAT